MTWNRSLQTGLEDKPIKAKDCLCPEDASCSTFLWPNFPFFHTVNKTKLCHGIKMNRTALITISRRGEKYSASLDVLQILKKRSEQNVERNMKKQSNVGMRAGPQEVQKSACLVQRGGISPYTWHIQGTIHTRVSKSDFGAEQCSDCNFVTVWWKLTFSPPGPVLWELETKRIFPSAR